MLDVITMSSKGQFVVPRDIRDAMGLKQQDKFVVVYDKNSILLKRIAREEANKAMMKLLDKFAHEFKKANITPEDVEEEIRNARAGK